jgi:hypothetical protein
LGLSGCGGGPVFKGISGNHVVWTWFFAWLNVVGCVVDVVFLHHGFWELKMCQVF